MYQFNGTSGGNHQQPQPGSYSNDQSLPTQQNQHPPPQNSSMQQQHYQMPPQKAQPGMPQYQNFAPFLQVQAPVFDRYSANQHQPPTYNGSYPGNPQFANQQPRPHASSPGVAMPHETTHFEMQMMAPNKTCQSPHPWQASQGRAQGSANTAGESCYNCGALDHWAQDCPEPRRAAPAGQMTRPFKRQKIHGGITSANHLAPPQHPPNLQRGWTHPATFPHTFPTASNSLNVQTNTVSEQRPWVRIPNQKPRMSSWSTNGFAPKTWVQQQPHQGSFVPQLSSPSHQSSWDQQSYHQSVNPSVGPSHNKPWSGQQQALPYSSISPVSTSGAPTWNVQQPVLGNEAFSSTRMGEQTVFTSQHTQSGGTPANQATQWSTQNLPTPAPSSSDSQIPSPATSNLNSIEQNTQPTPRHTQSPGRRHGSVSSIQKKNQDPRTHQAAMVADLFSSAAQSPASTLDSPGDSKLGNESAEDIEDELDELYGLDFPDTVFEHSTTSTNPALPVAQPLPSVQELDASDQLLRVDASSLDASLSKYFRDVKVEDFLKNVQESAEWNVLKNDPVFAKIKANTATVTFNELLERRCQLVKTFGETDGDDSETEYQHQETNEERLAREQEERLAALGVTGTAKPIKASSTDAPFSATPSPAEIPVTRRVSGDPGWKHYENGRPLEHCTTSFQSPPSATKDSQSIPSTQYCSPTGHSPYADKPGQQPYRKSTQSEASKETDDMPKGHDSDPKPCKPRFKQPKVAAAYGRRW